MSEYTDYQWWDVVYQYNPDTEETTPPEPWQDEGGGPDGEYATVQPLLASAVTNAMAGDSILMGIVVDAYKDVGETLLEFAREMLLPRIGDDPAKFMCVNAATVVAGFPTAGALCLAGDGSIIITFGLGVPSGEYIIGQTTNGTPASNLLTGTSFSSSVGEGGVLTGLMQSIPAGDVAIYNGFGVSPSPLGLSITYGFAIGNVNTGILPKEPFGHEGGG